MLNNNKYEKYTVYLILTTLIISLILSFLQFLGVINDKSHIILIIIITIILGVLSLFTHICTIIYLSKYRNKYVSNKIMILGIMLSLCSLISITIRSCQVSYGDCLALTVGQFVVTAIINGKIDDQKKKDNERESE